MGHHYAPKQYLKGFTTGNTIWAHDKLERRSFPSQVKTVANETMLYTDALENRLESKIEAPAQPVISKICQRLPIDEDDRRKLAKYIIVQWKRVPKARARAMERLPQVANEVETELNEELDRLLERHPDSIEKISGFRASVANEMQRNVANPLPYIWHHSIESDSGMRLVDSLMSMNWRFLETESPRFLTSDNPVFFFEFEGIGRPTSELTFPISSTVALWASRSAQVTGQYLPATSQAIKEINRRTASNCTRFVYSCANESWMLPFITKGDHALSRLQLKM